MKKVKIYALSDPITKEVMYIGRTRVRLSARMSSHYYCSRHGNTPRDKWIADLIKNKLKPSMKVIEDVDESIWRDREKYWIDYYRQINPDLTNLAAGGEGPLGVIRTEEFTQTLSEIRSKPIYQLDFNFNILGKYSSCKAAVLATGIPHVGSSARNIGRKSAGGYVWIYVSDYEDFIKAKHPTVFQKDYSYLHKIVHQYDLSGNLIKSWNSVRSASKENGYSYLNILKAARGERKTYKKFIWKF